MGVAREFTLALIQSLLPWVTIWVLAKYFLLQGKTNAALIESLTRQVLATKHPWAAQQALSVLRGEQLAEDQLKAMDTGDTTPQQGPFDTEEDLA